MAARVEFRILGPLEVRIDGAQIAIGGPKQRALLALLLLNANRVVSRDRLIDELLEGGGSDAREHALQVQVSRLRKVLDGAGSDRLAARPPGYVLRVDVGELDLQTFEGLVGEGHAALAAGDAARAAELLKQAVLLWHGRPLADLELEHARGDVRRLEELRLAAIEDRVDAELALGLHAALIPELEPLVREHPSRERLRGQQMLALYRAGRHAEALDAFREVHAYLRDELGLAPSDRLQALQRAILTHDAGLAEPVTPVCPFKGLAPFAGADAAFFVGRERIVDELVSRLVQTPLVAVLGASGSGKSSAVQAGLMPALARGALPGSKSWRQVVMRPGAHPVRELERHTAGDEPLVLAVDQFEELFTLCTDAAERRAFVEALLGVDARVVLTMRLDFYGQLDPYPTLAERVATSHILVRALGEDELRRSIELPAERAELTVEPRLVDALVRDVIREPGALPLLSTALLELWQERDGRTLTLASYERLGRVEGAVARLAESAYRSLRPADQDGARRIMLRLSAGGSDGEPIVRRRAPLAEVARDAETARVVASLTASRLLTAGEGTIEVAHEALLQHWPRLQEWLAEDVEGRRLNEHLSEAAREWERNGRDRGDLYRGARLAAALEWADDEGHALELAPLERGFLDEASAASGRATRRLRIALALALLLLAGACVAGLVAVAQWRHARDESTSSEAGRLGAQALLDPRLDRALLLAREAVNLDDSLLTRSDLLAALLRSPEAIAVLRGNTERVIGDALSPNGTLLAVATDDGAVVFWDASTLARSGRPFAQPAGPPYAFTPLPQPTRALAFAPDGQTLALGSSDGAQATIDLVDTRTHRSRLHVTSTNTLTADAAFTPDGRTLFTGETAPATGPRQSDPAEVIVARSTRDGAVLKRSAPIPHGRLAGVTADGRFLLVTSGQRESLLLEAHTLARSRKFEVGGIGAVSPDGQTVVLGRSDGTVVLLDLGSGRRRTMSSRTSAAVDAVAFNSNGRMVATASTDGSIAVWSVGGASLLATLEGHSTTAESPAFSPDGRTLYSASTDGTVIVWDLGGSRRFGLPVRAEDSTAAAASPRDLLLAVSPSRGGIALLDTRTGRTVATLSGPVGQVDAIAFSRDGALVAAAGSGPTTVWNVAGRQVARVLPTTRHANSLAFSPRGDALAVGLDSASTILFDTASGRRLASLPSNLGATVSDVAFSSDGSLLAITGVGGIATVWDVRRRTPVLQFQDRGITYATRFAPNGPLVATGDDSGQIFLWDRRTGKPVGAPLNAHSAVLRLAYSPDGKTLATSSADGKLRLWDVAGRRLIGAPLAGGGGTTLFLPDGKTLAGVSPNGTGVLWPVDPEAWNRRACQVARRNLTTDEWEAFLPDRSYRRVCP